MYVWRTKLPYNAHFSNSCLQERMQLVDSLTLLSVSRAPQCCTMELYALRRLFISDTCILPMTDWSRATCRLKWDSAKPSRKPPQKIRHSNAIFEFAPQNSNLQPLTLGREAPVLWKSPSPPADRSPGSRRRQERDRVWSHPPKS